MVKEEGERKEHYIPEPKFWHSYYKVWNIAYANVHWP